MLGNWILVIRQWWKELWCVHDYKGIPQTDFRFKQCIKCGRVIK